MNTPEAKAWLKANRSAKTMWMIVLIYVGLVSIIDLFSLFSISTITHGLNASLAVTALIVGLIADVASVWLVWRVNKWALIPLGLMSLLALSFLHGLRSYLPNVIFLLYLFGVVWPMSQKGKQMPAVTDQQKKL